MEQNQDSQELETIKTILFSEESEKLNFIEKKLNLRIEQDQEIFVKNLKYQLKEDPQPIIDALAPWIGKLISRYISESISELVDKINHKIENQFSFTALKRKFKSKVQGVSESEILLKEIESDILGVMILDRQSGVLEYSFLSSQLKDFNADLCAGMLSAIHSFSKDTLGSQSPGLHEIDYEDYQINIEGSYEYLFVLLSKNNFSRESKKRIQKTISGFKNKYKKFFQDKELKISQEFSSEIQELIQD